VSNAAISYSSSNSIDEILNESIMNDSANFLPKAAISLLKQLPNANNTGEMRSGQTASEARAALFPSLMEENFIHALADWLFTIALVLLITLNRKINNYFRELVTYLSKGLHQENNFKT
jgi:hypothetical protein